MSTDIDWASKPEPWRSIGLSFAKDLRRICGFQSIPQSVAIPALPSAPAKAQRRGRSLRMDARPRGDIRLLRQLLRISQAEAGELVGVSHVAVSLLEKNGTGTSAKIADRLVQLLTEWRQAEIEARQPRAQEAAE